MKDEVCMPNSDLIFQHKNEDGVRVEYYTQVLRKSGRLNHNISIGDICAIRNVHEGCKSSPFDDFKTIVGQVLALTVKREAVGRNTFEVIVRRLARWNSEAHNFATKQSLRKANKATFFRPDDQSLLETMSVESYSLSDVLRADIRILDVTHFVDSDRLEATWNDHSQAWEVSLCCPLRVDLKDKISDVRNDWNQYERRRSDSTLPAALKRGIELLPLHAFVASLQSAWKARANEVFSVDREIDMKIESKPKATGAKPRTLTSALSQPSSKRKQTKRTVQFSESSVSSKRSRATVVTDATSSIETATETSISVSRSTSTSTTPIPLRPSPLGDPVFTTSRRTSSSIVYIEGLEMNVDEAAFILRGKRKRMKLRWQFKVGDLVILRCDETLPPRKPFVEKKSAWFPFRVKWSVAQVVAMYYQKGNENEIKMQVRWFYRPDELNQSVQEHLSAEETAEFFDNKNESRILIEVDEHVNEVPVESAVGRAKLTGDLNPKGNWRQPKYHDAVPELVFICRYAYMSAHDEPRLYRVRDWTDYGALSSGPLYRGLSCSKCVTGITPKLFQRYKSRICQNLQIEDLETSDLLAVQQSTERRSMEWRTEEFDCARASCNPTDCCHGDKQREFFSTVNIQIVKERCDARGIAKKSGYQELRVSIGDFVCITSTIDVAVPTAENEGTNRWFPFKGPFIYVQVLSIFRKAGKRSSAVMLEVRRFFRRSELVPSLSKYLPPKSSRENEEEVLESFEVETIAAGRVLGKAEMFLGHHIESSRISQTDRGVGNGNIARPKCRCTFFLATIAFQRIFCADSTPLKWGRRMVQRGLSASLIIKGDRELAASIEFCLGIAISHGNSDSHNLFLGMIQEAKKQAPAPNPLFTKTVGNSPDRISIYSSVSIEAPWSTFSDEHILCSPRDRKDCWWKVCVGDVVAVRRSNGRSSRRSLYTCLWEPAHVVAIDLKESEGSNTRNYRFHVRWLRKLDSSNCSDTFPLRICDSIGDSLSTLSSTELLGPIYTARNEDEISLVWNSAIPYLPSNVVICEPMKTSGFSEFVRTTLVSAKLYTDSELKILFDALDGELRGFSSRSDEDALQLSEAEVSDSMEPTPQEPFYTDSSGTRFYRKLLVEPSMDDFVEELRGDKKRIGVPWVVNLGDSVVVKYPHGCGEAKFGIPSSLAGKKRKRSFPLEDAWAVGEVISIFSHNNPSKGGTQDEDQDCIKLELRWYYRAPEIKGSVDVIEETSRNICEEIFETDHYDTCSASSLRCPALIHERPVGLGVGRFHLGMPVLEFSCCRFWSPRRGSLVPVESTKTARNQRGRIHSPQLMHDAGLRAAIETLSGCPIQDAPKPRKNWQSNFNDVIQKLSLTDASKEGFKSSKAIIGRDKEMNQIFSFLRLALIGKNKEGKCSLFIAGPPGVGKTACVRAAISELEQLRSNSEVPPFDFVCMNGMEMRYPFEAYVQLWEKISGIATRPEVAALRLEAYFTKDESIATKEAKKSDARSVVVLLDEIDYLVTKNQSVLYNFFDWPTHNQQRRLIVLGVSNTLNLADQLHTRVQSRIGSRRCIFKAYDAEQIENILRAKLSQATDGTIFDEDAIVFVSKKTASLSGDIRRAFQICRTAAEHVMREHSAGDFKDERDPLVTIRDAVKVSRDSFNSAKSQAIARCSAFEALLLVSLASLSKSTGRELGGFDMEEVLIKMEALANGLGDARYLPAPTLAEAMNVVSRLAEGDLVSAVTPKSASLTYNASEAGSGGPWPLVSLTVDDLSVLLALKKSTHKSLAEKYLGMKFF